MSAHALVTISQRFEHVEYLRYLVGLFGAPIAQNFFPWPVPVKVALNPSRGMSARGAWECVWAHAVHISGYIPGFGTPPGHMKRLNGVPATGPAPTALLARQVPLGDMARG